MNSGGKPILYSYWRSSCSWRVRIALELKKIPYEYQAVNLLKEKNPDDQFLKLNPMGFVPALVHNGNVLTQSLAIIEYLDEVFPGPHQLIAGTPGEKGRIRALALILVADTQPLQNLSVQIYHGGDDADKRLKWAQHYIGRGFHALEKQLEKTAGRFSFGDKICLVDVCIPPQVSNARRFGVDMSAFPIINRIDAALSEIDEFKKAVPDNQPDAVKQ